MCRGALFFPSVLGLAVAALVLFSTIMTSGPIGSAGKTDAEAGAAVIFAGMGFGIAVLIGAISLVSGLVGWLFLMTRKVFNVFAVDSFLIGLSPSRSDC